MPRERWTPDRRRERTRAALLDAASEVFAQRGFHAASLDEIADAAGYTRGAIAFNFGSKEDLFLAVVERHNEALLEAYARVIERMADRRPPPLDEFAAVWNEVEAGDVQTLLLVLELRLYALRNPGAKEKIAAFEQRAEETVSRFIAEQTAATGGRLKLPAAEFGAILYAATYGLQQHVAICPNDHERLFERFLELATTAVEGEEEPAPPRASQSRSRQRTTRAPGRRSRLRE